MNRDQAKAAVKNFEVIEAFAEGKVIQCRDHASGVWRTVEGNNPDLTHLYLEFRVKPEPQYLYVVEDKSVHELAEWGGAYYISRIKPRITDLTAYSRVSKYVKVEED